MLDSVQSGQLASRDSLPQTESRSAQCKSAQSTSASWCSISWASRFLARVSGAASTICATIFLGGRTAPWWALACSIVATETSTLTIIGTPAIAYGGNLGFLQLVLGYLVARVILCVVLIPQYFQGEFYTAYQLLEKRFGARMRSVAAVVFMGTRALAEGVRISAIGKVVSVAFGTGDRVSILIITVLTMFYTFEGGMRAVIWTDVVQFFLYLAGSVGGVLIAAAQNPGRMA